MKVVEKNQPFPYALQCMICGGEVKRIIITLYEVNDVRRLTTHRCQNCLRLFNKLDDVDILIQNQTKEHEE